MAKTMKVAVVHEFGNPLPTIGMVLAGFTLRGSIVETRLDFRRRSTSRVKGRGSPRSRRRGSKTLTTCPSGCACRLEGRVVLNFGN